MRKSFFIFLLMFSLLINAQVRRIVLLEVFTNSGCGTCANSNEILQEFYSKYYGGVISVRYHPNFPDPRDPMYSDAAAEIDNRVAYYNILYTPQILFNGDNYGAPESESALWRTMLEKMSRTSPVWIDVFSEITDDTLYATVNVTAYGNLNEREMKLRATLVERNVHFDEPPGANGETDFPDVMRKMLPDTAGISLSAISEGQTLSFSFATDLNDNWRRENLSVVAWIQSDATKEVFQANSDIPTVIIETDAPNESEVQTERSYESNYKIVNYSAAEIPIEITYSTNRFYDAWNYTLFNNGAPFDTLEYTLGAHDTLLFSDFLETDIHTSLFTSAISVRNVADSFPYRYRHNKIAYVKNPNVLIINTSDKNSLDEKIIPIVRDTLGFDFSVVESEDTRYWLDVINRTAFQSAWLLSGDISPAYEDNDIRVLLNLLDNGGSVIASGQRILSTRGNYQSSRNFCDNYLDAQFVERSAENEIIGINGNAVSDGLTFALEGNYAPQPEIVVPKNGFANPLFVLANDNDKIASLINENENFKTIYTGFGIEEIADDKVRAEFLRRVFERFGINPNAIEEVENFPTDFVLKQNYPNPFNPTTTISYSIPTPSVIARSPAMAGTQSIVNVALTVYNALGQKIATLVNRAQAAGNYTVQFDATDLPSGVYFYTLRAGEFVATKKMILMK